jgi:hypothetical protein
VKVGAVVGDGGPQGALTRLSCSLLGEEDKKRNASLRRKAGRRSWAGLGRRDGIGSRGERGRVGPEKRKRSKKGLGCFLL